MRVIQQVQDRLLACPPEDLAGEHVEVARLLCGEFELSGLGLLEVDTTEGRLCFSWPAAPSSIRLADYPWVVADLRRSEVVRIDVRSLAALSRPTRMELERFKIGSLLLIPRPASELEFALAVAAQQEQTWSTDLIGELRVAGGLLAVSELRRDSHEVAARARERFQSSLTEQGLLDLHERLARAERLGRGSVLVSGAAHDLSNLITPVATYSELALIAKEDDERRELLRNLHRAAYHAQQLCDQLLDFLRGEPPRRSSLNLSDLVRQVVAQQSVSLDPGVRLDLVACVDSAMLRGNAIQLREAVQCLVVNAIQAVQSSGGSVEVRLEEVGSNWQLRVSDDGPGVDPRLADRLCEPFVTSKGSQGTGLGLPLVRT
ncbi:MAG TPA: hypothetical protein DEA08_21495, partial [Planctomycetes bacterium]|nr:hypothetical protein [Planctomycetota bacterium]